MVSNAKVVRIEYRTCPFCGHKYMRNVYRKASVDSICPKCRKRSDRTFYRPGRYKSPVLTECKRPGCNKMFYKLGNVNYCSEECKKIAKAKSDKIRTYNYRKDHPEKMREYNKKYYKKHKEQINARARRYREKNKEKFSIYYKERYRKQKEENIKNSK